MVDVAANFSKFLFYSDPNYQKTIQTAFKEVADALAVLGTINRQITAQQSLVNGVAETYRLAYKRYTEGIEITSVSLMPSDPSMWRSEC